jgi:hypothetical protein
VNTEEPSNTKPLEKQHDVSAGQSRPVDSWLPPTSVRCMYNSPRHFASYGGAIWPVFNSEAGTWLIRCQISGFNRAASSEFAVTLSCSVIGTFPLTRTTPPIPLKCL